MIATARTARQLLSTSHHEAGHAVVACIFGVVRGATIEPDMVDGTAGLVRFSPPLNATQEIAVRAAGFIAELHGSRKTTLAGSSRDIRDIGNLLTELRPSVALHNAPEFIDGVKLSLSLVKTNWKAIRHVARRLRIRGTLTGHEIRTIVARHRRGAHHGSH